MNDDRLDMTQGTPVPPDMLSRWKGWLTSPAGWFAVLVVYILLIRLWNLPLKVMHHDESLFAYYGYWLYKGNGYDYQPILHGPVLQNISALFFLLFGDDQWTMRLPAAVGGLLMFPVAWAWRRYMGGAIGALAVTGLIALSPSIGFYARFLRNDVPYLTVTMWCAYLLIRAMQTTRPGYVWGAILSALLMFSMMESSIFFFAACLAYLGTMVAADLLVWRHQRTTESNRLNHEEYKSKPWGPRPWLEDKILMVLLALAFMVVTALIAMTLHFGVRWLILKITGQELDSRSWIDRVINSMIFTGAFAVLAAFFRKLDVRFAERYSSYSATEKARRPFGKVATWTICAIVSGIAATIVAWLFDRILAGTLPVYELLTNFARRIHLFNSASSGRWILYGLLWIGFWLIALLVTANWRRPMGYYDIVGRFSRVVWKNKWHVIAAVAVSVMIYTTLFTTYFTFTLTPEFDHKARDFSGEIKPLTPVQIYKNTWDYWWDQHKEHRIKGPFHYYLPILLLYELPILGLVLLGWMRAFRKAALPGLHVFIWAALHILLLIVVLGMGWMGRPIDWTMMDTKFHLTSPVHLFMILLYVQLLVYMAPMLFRQGRRVESFVTFWGVTALFAYSYAGEKVPWLTVHTVGPFSLLAAFELVRLWKSCGQNLKSCGKCRRYAFLIIAGLAVLYQVRSNHLLLFVHPWSPAERLVYNHTSPDVEEAVQIVNNFANRTNFGKQFPMFIQGEMGWPLHWYLREYSNFTPTLGETVDTTSRPLVMVDWHGAGSENLRNNYVIRRMKVREWWEPELLDFSAMADIYLKFIPLETQKAEPMESKYAASLKEWKKLWHYLAYREIWLDPNNPGWSNGANEFALCIRKDIDEKLLTYDWLSVTPKRVDVPVYVP